MVKNPHAVLGVGKDASSEEIKKAYRKLARDHHPDINGGDDKRFKEITEAYEILTDPKARAKNEEERFRNAQRSSPFGGGPFWRTSGPQDIDDLMKEFMRQTGFNSAHHFHTKVKKKVHGASIAVRVFLSLEEAFNGKTVEIRINRHERINSEKRAEKARKIKINIPKGAKHGQQLVLRNQGNQGINGGRDGDIIVNLQIKPHPYYLRRDHDIYGRLRILFTQAILGDIVKYKNIDGEMVEVIIPEETQHGDVIEVQGKGMPIGNSTARGYLKLIVELEIPKITDEKQMDVFRIIQEQAGRKDNIQPIPFEE